MARRLRPRGDASGTPPRRDRGTRHGLREGATRPRRGIQLLVWVLVLAVFTGLSLLSRPDLGSGADPVASGPAVPAAQSATAAQPTTAQPTTAPVVVPAGERVLAADEPWWKDGDDPDEGGDTPPVDCEGEQEERSFLPLNRWTSFELHVVDNSWIIKSRLFISMIASLMFMIAALAWRLLGMIMSFSLTFDMVCQLHKPINSVVLIVSKWASWFLIPAWLYVLALAARRWTRGGRKGPAEATRMVAVFAVATGMIFFFAEESNTHQEKPLEGYTVPWLAASVQRWFGEMTTSLTRLGDLADVETGEQGTVFYDNDPVHAGPVTCAALDEALYVRYEADNANTEMKNGRAAMVQVSKMWEISLVRSWQVAQFGEGSTERPSPAHAACRYLESNADVSLDSKLLAYDLSNGHKDPVTTKESKRGFYLSPTSDDKTIMIAWGACQGMPGGLEGEGSIRQWKNSDGFGGKKEGCKNLFSKDEMVKPRSGFGGSEFNQKIAIKLDVGTYYFNGGDELNDKLGKCVATDDDCRANWDFVKSWLGANQAQRLTQGLMSMVVAVVFLFVLGPMAIGLMLASIALACLAMAFPVTLLLLSMGMDKGKKMLKATGAMAAVKTIFTLALTALVLLMQLSSVAIAQSLSGEAPNLLEQAAQAAAPLLALFLFKKFVRALGMGDISSMTGALGFAGAAALKATGDRELSRTADRIPGELGKLGVGKKRLSALDERSLQRRMLGNRATKGLARAAGRGAKWAARPVTRPVGRVARKTAGSLRAAGGRVYDGMLTMARSGTPAQRAKAFAGLAAVATAASTLAPWALPLAAVGAAGASRNAGRAGVLRAKERWGAMISLAEMADGRSGPALKPGSAAGLALSRDHEKAQHQTDDLRRKIVRVRNPDKRRAIVEEHVGGGLDMIRANLWGGDRKSGVNLQFRGWSDEFDMLRDMTEQSEKMGFELGDLVFGADGLALPAPAYNGHLKGQRVFAKGTTPENVGLVTNFFDSQTLQRRIVDGVEETDEQYVARLFTHGIACGGFTADGRPVDVLLAKGIDVRDPETRERVQAWIDGKPDVELSSIIFKAGHSEEMNIQASRGWVQDQRPSVEVRQEHRIELAEGMLASAHGRVSDLLERPLAQPTPTGLKTVREVKEEFDETIEALKEIATEARSMHRGKGSMEPAEYNDGLMALSTMQGELAEKLNMLSEVLRDEVSDSATSRGILQLRADALDPDIPMKITDLQRAADRLAQQLQQNQDAWHQLVEQHAGGVFREPATATDADALLKTLSQFSTVMTEQIGSAEKDNAATIERLRELQRRDQEILDLSKVDPHQAALRRTTGRQLIQAARQSTAAARTGSDT